MGETTRVSRVVYYYLAALLTICILLRLLTNLYIRKQEKIPKCALDGRCPWDLVVVCHWEVGGVFLAAQGHVDHF